MYFEDLPKENLNIETIEINQEKLHIDENIFKENNIIIVKSETATGKTKCIAQNIHILKEKYPDSTILSIVNLISLADEQINTFQKEGKITLINYRNSSAKALLKTDSVICINSLIKFINNKDSDFKELIIFIDEINDILNTLTHNDRLNNNLNCIYRILVKMIKNCKAIILSDATINININNLLKCRNKPEDKRILIKNNCKKFNGINANQYLNEDEFINKLDECIKNDEYFLFGSDIKSKITSIYEILITKYKEKENKFILKTSDTNIYITDTSNQFKDKFVFYSPSITTGVSYINVINAQYQFIYISNNPLIKPISIHQMGCRTRNMKELIFYCENIKPKQNIYKSLEDLENKYSKQIEINDKILRLSTTRDENDDENVIKNPFFKMWCYNEYINEIYNTDYLKHYKQILTNAGFTLKTTGIKDDKIDKKRNIKKHNDIIKKINDEEIQEFINQIEENEEVNKRNINYELYLKRIEIIGVGTKEQIEKYQVFLQDNRALTNYFHFQDLLRTKEYIKKKFENMDLMNIKKLYSNKNKICLLEKFEKESNINRLDLKNENIKIPTFKNEEKDFYKNMFRTKKEPNTKDNTILMYIQLLENICGDFPIIKKLRKRNGGNKIKLYELNTEFFKDMVELIKLKNPKLKNYNHKLIEEITGIKPEENTKNDLKDDFDDELFYNKYLFDKYGLN